MSILSDNIINAEIVNLEEYVKRIEKRINDVIRNSTYPEITKYIDMLPGEGEREESLFCFGISYLNEYYKIIGKLDKLKTPEIENLKYQLYILYLNENYNRTVFTFDEFITFSRLLNTVFLDYNHAKIRKCEKEPYQTADEEINYIVNKVASNVFHSPHPYAYEITKFRLKILLNALNMKKKILLNDEFSKIDLDDNLLSETLSEKRIEKLKKKKQ